MAIASTNLAQPKLDLLNLPCLAHKLKDLARSLEMIKIEGERLDPKTFLSSNYETIDKANDPQLLARLFSNYAVEDSSLEFKDKPDDLQQKKFATVFEFMYKFLHIFKANKDRLLEVAAQFDQSFQAILDHAMVALKASGQEPQSQAVETLKAELKLAI